MISSDDWPSSNAADRYDRALEPFTGLLKYSHRTRALVWGLAGSLAYDVLITGALAVYAYRADSTAKQLEEVLAARAQVSCESRNDFKRLDLQRWQLVIKAANDRVPGETSKDLRAKRLRNAGFLVLIQKADVLEDCTTIVVDGHLAPPTK